MSRNSWVDVVVTGAVTVGKVVTLGLRSTNSDGAYYDSLQAGALAPQLVVTTGVPTSSTTSSSSTSSSTTSTSSTSTSTSTTTTTTPPSGFQLAAVGDMVCAAGSAVTTTTCHQMTVSNLVANDPTNDAFMALGDLTYGGGSLTDFQTTYEPTFGRFKAKTRPVVGNHEYTTPNASGYFAYFGAAAGDPAQGYYSFDVGTAWHVVVLNANCTIVACAAGSAQDTWLRADLAATPRACVLAAWHQPRFSSGVSHGNDATVTPFWNALQQYNAELVLDGHVHNYERFAPQLPDGTASATGIREFVVGTGGRSLDAFGTPVANSQVRLQTFGVLRLTLGTGAYSWQFVNEAGAVLDSGTGSCH